jgi:hypothetical protein
MFGGIYTRNIPNNLNLNDIVRRLERIGLTSRIGDTISIQPFESSFAYKSSCRVVLSEFKEERTIQLIYTFKPSLISWTLGICFFPLGFLILILPYKANDEFENELFLLKWD